MCSFPPKKFRAKKFWEVQREVLGFVVQLVFVKAFGGNKFFT